MEVIKMNYPIYGNNNQFYMQDLQNMRERIDNQIKQMQQLQSQQQVPQAITQNFQITPTTNNNELEIKYAGNVDEVKNTIVMKTGVFLTKDFSTLWIKDVTGNIKTFRTEEVIEMDDKDREIDMLKKQIEEMKGMIVDANSTDNTIIDEPVTKQKSTRVSSSKRTNAK
jgi:hypothetical protein